MAQMTASRALERIQGSAEKIRNDETAEVGTMSSGDVVRQGDLYVVAIPSLPCSVTPTKQRQLVPGNTQGSRHVLRGAAEVFTANPDEVLACIRAALAPQPVELAPPLIGPVFRCEAPVELDHPEHGNRILPAGVYATVYQRLLADEVRRVLD